MMDDAYRDQLLALLGKRYRLGSRVDEGFELLFRHGKTEFHPSRLVVGLGEDGRKMRFSVDFRVPKDADENEVKDLREVLDSKTMSPRGFSQESEKKTEMFSESGDARGYAMTVVYEGAAAGYEESAKHIRALVESLENPIVLGVHGPEDVVAKDPPPPPPKPKTAALDELEVWKFRLDDGLLSSLIVEVNPNDRTLRVQERKLVQTKQIGEITKLAHVAKLTLAKTDGGMALLAVGRDGTEKTLATGSGSQAFVETAQRLAKKIMIPLEEASA